MVQASSCSRSCLPSESTRAHQQVLDPSVTRSGDAALGLAAAARVAPLAGLEVAAYGTTAAGAAWMAVEGLSLTGWIGGQGGVLPRVSRGRSEMEVVLVMLAAAASAATSACAMGTAAVREDCGRKASTEALAVAAQSSSPRLHRFASQQLVGAFQLRRERTGTFCHTGSDQKRRSWRRGPFCSVAGRAPPPTSAWPPLCPPSRPLPTQPTAKNRAVGKRNCYYYIREFTTLPDCIVVHVLDTMH